MPSRSAGHKRSLSARVGSSFAGVFRRRECRRSHAIPRRVQRLAQLRTEIPPQPGLSREIVAVAARGGRRVVLRTIATIGGIAGLAFAHLRVTDAVARLGWRVEDAGTEQRRVAGGRRAARCWLRAPTRRRSATALGSGDHQKNGRAAPSARCQSLPASTPARAQSLDPALWPTRPRLQNRFFGFVTAISRTRELDWAERRTVTGDRAAKDSFCCNLVVSCKYAEKLGFAVCFVHCRPAWVNRTCRRGRRSLRLPATPVF